MSTIGYENAIERDDVDYVKAMLQEHPEYLNARDRRGKTLLHFAATEGARNVVDHLLAAGADVNIQDNRGHTALSGMGEHYAKPDIEDAYCYIAEQLLERGADVNNENRFGYTVIYYATRAGHIKLFDLLVVAGADVHSPVEGGSTVFHVAVFNDRRELIYRLKDMGADIHACRNDGYNVLNDALGNPELLTLLLSWKVSPHQGFHLLLNAVYDCQCEESVRILLEAGIDTSPTRYSRKYEEEETALDIAYRKNLTSIIKMIEDYNSTPLVKGALIDE